ncbi:MAG TPA: hypothetical protein VGN74_05565 [Brevundimonas sp.]|nr:hypothetical protein [Brevundimonas sp.]
MRSASLRYAALNPGKGGGAQTPVSVLGAALKGWWSSDNPARTTVSGVSVTAWADEVAGYVVNPGTSSTRPAVSDAGFGGARAIQFDGVDDYLNMFAPTTFPAGGSASEIWLIGQNTALVTDAGARVGASYGDGVFSSDRRLRRNTSTTNILQATSGNISVAGGGAALTTRHVLRAIFGVSSIAVEVDNLSRDTAAATLSTNRNQFAIGAIPNGSLQFWQGLIRDVLVTDPLTAEQAAWLYQWALPRRNL